MSEWNTNCWSSATRSLFWWSVSRDCNDATSASSARRTLSCQVSAPRRWTQTIHGGENCATRGCKVAKSLKRRFVHIDGEYASSNEWSLVWREVDAAFESRILTGAVINSNHIEPQRFLEDAANVALERVRDAVERHGSVKVNTVFNGEFVTKNKRANKSIITKNSEIHRFARVARHRAYPSIAPRAFQERDSGWALSRIFNLTINVYKLNPLRAECHRSTTRNSDKTNGNQCSYDGQYACFAWSVVAALYLTEKYTERESSYPHYDSTESHKHWVPKDFKRHF